MITAHIPRPSSPPTPAPAAAQAPEATTPAPAHSLPVLTPCSLLETLIDAALPNLSARQLEEIASQSVEMAQDIAERAAGLSRGVACVVPSDMCGDTGGFWTEQDLSGLLGHFGDVFQQVAGLVSVSRAAAHHAGKAKR